MDSQEAGAAKSFALSPTEHSMTHSAPGASSPRFALLSILAAIGVVLGVAWLVGHGAAPRRDRGPIVSVPAVPASVAFPLTTEEGEGCDPSYGGAPPPEAPPGPCVGASGQPEEIAQVIDENPTGEQMPVPVTGDTAIPDVSVVDVHSDVSEDAGVIESAPQESLYSTSIPGTSTALQAIAFREALGDGSVNVANRGLVWTERDAYFPGVVSQSDLVVSRRYFSRLSFDGVGSVGAGWVSTLYERVVEIDAGHLRHVDWNQPFNDPELYFVADDPIGPQPLPQQNGPSGPDIVYQGPAQSGARIVKESAGTYRMEFRDGRVHRFDSSGRVTSRTDSYGNIVSFGYDGQGNLNAITDSRGQDFKVTTDAQGYLETIVDPLGHTLTYTNVNGYLTEVLWPATDVFVPAADQESGTLVNKTTKRSYGTGTQSQRLENIYDDSGAVVLHVDYESNSHEVRDQWTASGGNYTFAASGSEVSEIDPAGWKTVYVRDSNDYVVEVHRYQANFRGHPARTVDQTQFDLWQLVRDAGCACGRLDGIIEPDGGEVHISYDAEWNVTEIRKHEAGDPTNAMVWTWGGYDSLGRAGWHIPPEGNAAADPVPHTVTYSRVADTDPSNPGGTIESVSIPGRSWRSWNSAWLYRRDSRGRVVESLRPSPNVQDLGRYERFEYWPAGGANSLMPKRRYQRVDQSIYNDFQWSATGRLLTITTQNGLVSSSTYDARGRKRGWTSATLPTAQAYQHHWDFDASGNVAQIRYQYWTGQTGAPGVTSHWIRWNHAYDSAGRNWKTVKDLDPSGSRSTTLYDFDANDRVSSYTDPDGNVSTVYYDEKGLPWLVSEGVGTPDAVTRTVSYTVDGDIAEIIEPIDANRTLTERFEYDELDRNDAWEIVGRERREYVYNDKRLNAEIRCYGYKNGVKTLLTRRIQTFDDWHDNPTQVVEEVHDEPGTSLQRVTTRQILYSSAGLPLIWSLNGTIELQIEYQSWGDVKRVFNATGNAVEFAYGPNGWLQSQLTTHSNGNGGTQQETKTYEVDLWGRYTRVTRQAPGEAPRVSNFEYDSLDQPVTIVDEAGNRHRREYRFDGALTKTVSIIAGGATPVERTTIYGRTDAGRIATLTDDRGGVVTFEYDARGRRTKEINPGTSGSFWQYGYDKHGGLVSVLTPTGRSIVLTNDNWGRPITRTVTLPGQSAPSLTNAYTYTAGGGIKRIDRSDNGLTSYVAYVRDGDGRMVREDQDGDIVDYTRDAIGRVTDITGPGGYAVHYEYDSHHRVGEVSIPLGGSAKHVLATHRWFGSGHALASTDYGDGTSLTVGRDAYSRPTAMHTVDGDGASIIDLAYGWDSRSLVKYEHRIHEGKGDVFRYDALRRLREVTRNSVDPATEWQSPGTTVHDIRQEFDLDDDNHRIQVTTTPDGGTPSVEGYAVDPARHHYTMVGGAVRTFSEDGNLEAHGTRSYQYDALDALIAVTDGAATVATYTYDAAGRRRSKTVNGVTTRYVYAGPTMLLEYRKVGAAAETLDASHYHGIRADSVIMSRRRDRVDLDQDNLTTDFVDLYHHTNRIGSALALTFDDGSGKPQVVETYEYDAFGQVVIRDAAGAEQAASPVGNPFLYTGREYDDETGLYHYRARAYDPATGGFLQEDPLGLADDINPVAYVLANPISFTDPFGTSAIGDVADEIITLIQDNPWLGTLITSTPIVAEIIELISAISGTDYTAWLEGGAEGEPESMGWWDRISRGAQAAITLAGAAVGVLMKFEKVRDKLKKLGAKPGGGKPTVENCFKAGTLVAVIAGFVAIEKVAIGMAVQSAPDPLSDEATVRRAADPDAHEAIVPKDWRLVDLRMSLGNASVKYISILRPVAWLSVNGITEGATVAMSLVEARKAGVAVVERVRACPDIETADPGTEIVTGLYRTTGAEVMDLWVEGVSESIVTTGTHPFWSVDRRCWVPTNCLVEGERVACKQGCLVVRRVRARDDRETVFNIEVRRHHTYFVTSERIWVHNSHVNKVEPVPGAGEHSVFKRDPQTGEITGYTEFDASGNPVKRFRKDGKPHGGVDPPLVLEPKPGKGPGSPPNRARPARPDEIPGGR